MEALWGVDEYRFFYAQKGYTPTILPGLPGKRTTQVSFDLISREWGWASGLWLTFPVYTCVYIFCPADGVISHDKRVGLTLDVI